MGCGSSGGGRYSDISKWVMQWVRVRIRVRVRVSVRISVRVRIRVRVSVSCAFSEAFVGIVAVGIAACTLGLQPRKYVGGSEYVLTPPPARMSHSFIQNCCWITLHVSK